MGIWDIYKQDSVTPVVCLGLFKTLFPFGYSNCNYNYCNYSITVRAVVPQCWRVVVERPD